MGGKVVTVMNMKGGVGKTTVAMHVAGALGRYVWTGAGETVGRKVLLIDYGAIAPPSAAVPLGAESTDAHIWPFAQRDGSRVGRSAHVGRNNIAPFACREAVQCASLIAPYVADCSGRAPF